MMKSYFNSHAVIGLGFGDEGKGLTTNALCHNLFNPIVARYSGGQQAGHTGVVSGISHVFSNFGSGSLICVPTYWSKYCTIDPVAIQREFEVLSEKCNMLGDPEPVLFIDGRCPVTTPYEKLEDQGDSAMRSHGTCGVGVGKTFAREEAFWSFTAGDLVFKTVCDLKLDNLWNRTRDTDAVYLHMPEFKQAVDFIRDCPNIHIVDGMPTGFDNVIFEGSQGLLLDQHNGFFPHVTRSNTGTKNILEMVDDPDLYLVTRAYQTRHGNGPMTNEHLPHNIIDNADETNVTNKYQGEFRRSILDVDLLRYAVTSDDGIRRATRDKKTLVITCCDLINGDFQYTLDGELHCAPTKEEFGAKLAKLLKIDNFITVDKPDMVW